MGLCKCRVVTNLFCFDHRKNVCEKCIASDHERCIVKSYLQWLQDSDFDPNCSLCHQALTGQVIRLTCLDLFHVSCLEKHCQSFPETTPVSGYSCPLCKTPILPNENATSTLALNIFQVFSTSPWAQKFITSSKRNSVLLKSPPPLQKDVSSLQSPIGTSNPIESSGNSKLAKKDTVLEMNDPDDYKYKRRNMPLMTQHGFIPSVLRSIKNIKAPRWMRGKGMILFMLLFLLLMVLFYGSVRRSGGQKEDFDISQE